MEDLQNVKEMSPEYDPLSEDMEVLNRQLQKSAKKLNTEEMIMNNILHKASICGRFQLNEITFQQLSKLLCKQKLTVNEVQESFSTLKMETSVEEKWEDIINFIKVEIMKIITCSTDGSILDQCEHLLTNALTLTECVTQLLNADCKESSICDANDEILSLEQNIQDENEPDYSVDVLDDVTPGKQPCMDPEEEPDYSVDVLDDGTPGKQPCMDPEEKTEGTEDTIPSKAVMPSPKYIEIEYESDDSICFLEEVKIPQDVEIPPSEEKEVEINEDTTKTVKIKDTDFDFDWNQPSTSKLPRNKNFHSSENYRKGRKHRKKYSYNYDKESYEYGKECNMEKKLHRRSRSNKFGSDLKVNPSHDPDREYFDWLRNCHHEKKIKQLEKNILDRRTFKRKYDRYYENNRRNGEEDKISHLEALLDTACKVSDNVLIQLILSKLDHVKLNTEEQIRMYDKLGTKIMSLVMDAKLKKLNK